MKLIRLILVISLFLYLQEARSQEKWRALTVSSISGTNFRGNHFNTFTSSFHWDFNKKYFFSNWTGFQIQYNRGSGGSWFASQSTLNRYVKNWILGAGVQYGTMSNSGIFQISDRSTFAITSVSYRWKFGKR